MSGSTAHSPKIDPKHMHPAKNWKLRITSVGTRGLGTQNGGSCEGGTGGGAAAILRSELRNARPAISGPFRQKAEMTVPGKPAWTLDSR
jgi:hypothetical protein